MPWLCECKYDDEFLIRGFVSKAGNWMDDEVVLMEISESVLHLIMQRPGIYASGMMYMAAGGR